ncbi:MAG TPA: ATP-binding protein [Anaerolineales bacterium]|nr:ATP-binding protein [Anaerolineales bacterium]HNO92886.1 ATP-binding protein [Anaerolineales bacterium]
MNENPWKSRWSNEQIKTMLFEQFDAFWNRETGIERTQLAEVERATSIPHAVIVSGLRRAGKSTLLAQMAHKLGRDSFYYVNFEDDRFLGFQPDDANHLYHVLVETFGERKIFVVDEVQNISGWEHFVRRFMDMDFKFYITGSNASLLSRELGTRLTGRYVPIELFPFSFREFLQFKKETVPDLQRMTTVEKALLNNLLNTYLQTGGIPDALKYPELPLLRTLYDDVLYRDIATRYRLEAVTALKELAFYLMSNPSSLVSFNKLKDQFRLGSVNTIKSYIDYMENSWLVFTLKLYDFSVKRQQIAPKKVYCIDTGLSNTVGFGFSPNTGKMLENLVFLALRRQTKEIYYCATPSGYEVDFYLPKKRQLIQVTRDLENPATREREVRALSDALKGIKVESALILSDTNENEFEIEGIRVETRSVAEWLISQ